MTTKTNSQPVKGFRDYTGVEAEKRSEIKKILVETFEKFGFEPAETPIIENEKFVKGENANDEAVSDVYKLKDKGKRKLALRYEFTFQMKRLMKNKKLPYKRYQIGPVFRDEPVSQNRFRQFTQCDIDVVGSTIKDEAEILAMTKEVLEKLGLEFTIYVGNRKIFEGILKVLFGNFDKESINELIRYFDKLDKQTPKEILKEIEKGKNKSSKLKNIKKLQLENIFLPLLRTLKNNDLGKLKDYYKGILENRGQKESSNSLFEEGYKEISELIKFSKNYGVKLNFNGALVRGLSYYNGTVYEIKSKDVKETIVAGGSYFFNNMQCSGISFGLDRLANISKLKTKKEKYLVVSLDEDKVAIDLAQKLRKKGKSVTLVFGKPTKALDFANSKKINNVIFVGEKEVKNKKFKIKDMKSGKERKLVL